VLGLEAEAGDAAQAAADGPSAADIQAQIGARQAAKAARNFAEADRIRDALKAQGIELIDRPGGVTEWLRS
jgi:cysteinyl-tRNA synthetase